MTPLFLKTLTSTMPMSLAAAVLAFFALLSSAATGQELASYSTTTPDPYASELTLLRSELNALRQQVQESHVSLTSAIDSTEECNDCYLADCCQDCAGHWSAGFDFVFQRPYLKESFKATRIDLLTGTQSLYGFDYAYELAPRFWVRYDACDGLGFDVRYQNYDHADEQLQLTADPTSVLTANAVTVIFPATIATTLPGDVLTVDDSLALRVLDVQGTQQFRIGPVEGRAGVGLRYVQIRQNYLATISTGGNVTQFLDWERAYDGIGPLIYADLTRPLGDNGLAAFATFRAALTFGDKTLRRTVDNATFPPIVEMVDAPEVVGVGEMALGAQWSRATDLGTWTFRGAYEAQLWTDAGAPTLTFLGFEGFAFSLALTR